MTITYKKLGDIATYINGYAFKPEDWGSKELPIIRIQNLTGSSNEINYYDGEIDEKYVVRNGDILIAWSASLGVHEWNGENALLNQHIFKVVFDKEKVNKDFFKFMVQKVLERTLQYLHGSTMKHITKKYFDNLLIPFPSKDVQEKIANTLLLAQSLVSKRKSQIEALDELTQSVFLEMFGDPRNNPNNFNKVQLGKLFEIKTGGTPSRENGNYWGGSIPWIKTTEVKENVIDHSEEFISEEGLENSNAVLLPVNTILIAMYGQGKTRGRTAKLGIEATTNQACAALLPNKEIDSDFIWKQLIIQYDELRALGRGGNQPNLNLNLVKQFEVIVPPISLQKEFVSIINRIELNKRNLNYSSVELGNLYSSLMKRAFKGELFT